MQELPEDLLSLVLNKLAVQDPLSLLRLSCVSRYLYNRVADNTSLWRKAFHGPELHSDIVGYDRLFYNQKTAELEADLASQSFLFLLDPQHLAAGYKELVAARWQRPAPSEHSLSKEIQTADDFVRFLFVVRKRGTLLLWGSCGSVSRLELMRLSCSKTGIPLSQDTRMEFLYTANKTRETMMDVLRGWGSQECKLGCTCRDLFVDIHAVIQTGLLGDDQSPQKVGTAFWQGVLKRTPETPHYDERSMVERFSFAAQIFTAKYQQPLKVFGDEEISARMFMAVRGRHGTLTPEKSSKSRKEEKGGVLFDEKNGMCLLRLWPVVVCRSPVQIW